MPKPEPVDKQLYKRVKREADKKFSAPTSAYKSSWIVREYKRRGGRYRGSKPRKSGLKRWYKEEWVDLNRPTGKKKSKYEKCGRSSSKKRGKYPVCRPSKVVTKKTPRTYKELSPKQISKAKRKKSQVKSKGRVQFGSGNSKSQYHGRKTSNMIKIPKNVKRTAQKAFELRDIGFRGATRTGWLRAKQLSERDSISYRDLRYMRNWYARHVYASYPTYKQWKKAGKPKNSDWFNKHGILSWLTWGGDAGLRWVNSDKVIKLLNEHFNKDYKKII